MILKFRLSRCIYRSRYEPHQRGGATVPYKSAIMKSTVPAGVKYGRFEARIKGASRWPGVCPAFWAWRHAVGHWTELDFVEMQESTASPKDIDFTSHVFPPTQGVPTLGMHFRCHPAPKQSVNFLLSLGLFMAQMLAGAGIKARGELDAQGVHLGPAGCLPRLRDGV